MSFKKRFSLFFMIGISIFVLLGFRDYSLCEETTSNYPKTDPVKMSRTVGTETFEYEVSYYSPSIEISIVTNRSDAKYDTPETAINAFVSAIVANDFDWWFDSFDQARKDALLGDKSDEYEELKNSELKEVSEKYRNKIIKLSTYIRYQNYILIDWTAYNTDGTKAFRMLTPLKQENELWKVTADENPASFLIFKWD